jgi:hypothetical protein
MADYQSCQQILLRLGISEEDFKELRTRGLLQPTVKDGVSFLSSQQVFRLRAAVRWSHSHKLPLLEAFARVEERWLAHNSALKE